MMYMVLKIFSNLQMAKKFTNGYRK